MNFAVEGEKRQKKIPQSMNKQTQNKTQKTSANSSSSVDIDNTNNDSSNTNTSDSRDLRHLVGRALVPFFLSNGAENTQLAAPDLSDSRDWSQSDGKLVKVRQFVDGYFVDSGSIGQNNPPTTNHPIIAATPVKIKKKPSNSSSVPVSLVTPESAKPPSQESAKPQKFAAPAFSNSPSPLKIPMPKFLSQSKNSQIHQTIQEEREETHTQNSDNANNTTNGEWNENVGVVKSGAKISLKEKFSQQQKNQNFFKQTKIPNPTKTQTTNNESQQQASTSQQQPLLLSPSSFHQLPDPSVSASSLFSLFPSSPSPSFSAVRAGSPKLLFLRESVSDSSGVLTQVPLEQNSQQSKNSSSLNTGNDNEDLTATLKNLLSIK